MRNIAQLKEAGFAITASTLATRCTSVASDKPLFWYYNTKFYDGMDEVHEHLEKAKPNAQGQYELLVAGVFSDDDVLLYNVLDQARYDVLTEARARFVTAQNDAQRARDDFEDALNTLEDYIA